MMLKHEVPRDAAGISYFSVVALFPAMLVMVTVVDVTLGWVNLHETVIQQIIALFPGSRQFLSANLREITTPSTAVAVACMAVVLWSASWMFTFMESAVNRAWGAPAQRTFWQSRMLGIAFIVLIGASLLTSAAITYFVSNVRARAEVHIPSSATASSFIGWFWYFVLLGAGLLIAILVFTLIFKWAPHHSVLWREALAGAAATTVLWEIGSFIFMNVVPFFDYQRIYGRMGAAIALLVWIYTSNLIMLFGANFSAQLHVMNVEKPMPYSGTFRRGTF
jgi:membrane protein